MVGSGSEESIFGKGKREQKIHGEAKFTYLGSRRKAKLLDHRGKKRDVISNNI